MHIYNEPSKDPYPPSNRLRQGLEGGVRDCPGIRRDVTDSGSETLYQGF